MKNPLWVLATVLLAASFFWVGQRFGADRPTTPRTAPHVAAATTSPIPVGQTFPNIALEDAEGRTFPLESLYDGRPLYLLALGAACGGCRFELERWQRELDSLPDDLQVIGVAPDEFQSMNEAWKETPPSFPVYRDVEGALQSAGIQDIPSGFGLGPTGTVVTADYGIASMPSSRLREFRAGLVTRERETPSRFETIRARAN